MKVLVIDDEADMIQAVETLLKLHGFEVYTHATGNNVPELVKECNPDVILLDINLSGKSGLEVCKELKAISDHPPIILFSAHGGEEASLKGCKADGFMPKPFKVKQLVDILSSYAN
jgi:DNA-binding response OmpR family regulator